jgi:hypothetical protein
MAVCAVCRHLRVGAGPGVAPAERDVPMVAPPGEWCPIWQIWVADPAATGCTLFEAIEALAPPPEGEEEPGTSDADRA